MSPRPEAAVLEQAGGERAWRRDAWQQPRRLRARHARWLAAAEVYYAVRMRRPAGIVSARTFHWHQGGIPISLWSGVGADRDPDTFVTLPSEVMTTRTLPPPMPPHWETS